MREVPADGVADPLDGLAVGPSERLAGLVGAHQEVLADVARDVEVVGKQLVRHADQLRVGIGGLEDPLHPQPERSALRFTEVEDLAANAWTLERQPHSTGQVRDVSP